jgi:16S rRNA (cytosine967-C5)-methyltransferase
LTERPGRSGRSDRSAARRRGGNDATPAPAAGSASRRLAVEALVRIETGGAYANLVLGPMLEKSDLDDGDRRFVTELVYGTTRMKRACDHLVDRFVLGETDDRVRAALRVGAYQLAFLGTPPHAAVAATVGAIDGKGRSVVNAVLRRVAEAPVTYPDEITELSYPDWLARELEASLGSDRARVAMAAMNRPAPTMVRADGYVQDRASQLVVEAVGAQAGELVVDLCAAPGGKATGLAATGATVVAGDRRRSRVGLIVDNAARLDHDLLPLVADGRAAPLPDAVADRVLVDAPCSGLGSLRRRPDARWRVEPEAPARLAELQAQLLDEAARLVRPGGLVVYSVCTFGPVEGREVVEGAVARHGLERLPGPGDPWRDHDGMSVIEPDDTDGMMLARLRRPT